MSCKMNYDCFPLVYKHSIKLSVKLFFIIVVMLFLFGGTALAEQTTSEDVVKFSGDLMVSSDEIILGDVVLFSGNAEINGKVEGDVVVFSGNATVNGEVTGNVVSFSGNLERGPEGIIHGNQVVLSTDINIDNISQAIPLISNVNLGFPTISYGFKFINLVSFLALALLVTALLPKPIENMGHYIETDYLKTGLIGLLTVIAVPFVALILLLTIIGIPLIPVFIFGVIILSLFGYLGVSNFVGRKLVEAFNLKYSQLLCVGIGIIVLWLIMQLPVLGGILFAILVFLSVGLIISTKFGTLSPWFRKQ